MKRFFQYLCIGLAGGALAFYNIGCGGSSGTSSSTTGVVIAGTASSGSGSAAVAAAPKQGIVDSMFAYLKGDMNSAEITNRIGSSFTSSADAAFLTGTALSGATVTVKDLAGNVLLTTTSDATGAWSGDLGNVSLDGYYVEITHSSLSAPLRKVGKKIPAGATTVSAGDINKTTTAITKVLENIGGVTFPSAAAKAAAVEKTGTLALTNLVNVFTQAVNTNPTGPIGAMIDLVQKETGNGASATTENSLVASTLSQNATLLSALQNFNAGAVNANKVAANAGATALTTSQTAVAKLESILVGALDTTAIQYAGDLGNVIASSTTPDTIASSITIETNVLNITTSTIGTTLSTLTTAIDLAPKASAYVDLTGATNWKKGITINAGAKVDVTASNSADPSLSPATNNLTRTCAAATGTAACTYAWSILDSTATALTTTGTTATTATATLDTSALTAGFYTIVLAVTNGTGTSKSNIPLVVASSTAIIPNVTITAPTLNPWYVNTNSAVSLTGTVKDNAGAALTVDGITVTSHWFVLSKPAADTTTTVLSTFSVDSLTSSFTPLAVGTYIVAFEAVGDANAVVTTTITAVSGTAPTAAPTGLSATGGTSTSPSVALTWTGVTNANGYYVYREYTTGTPTLSTSSTALTTVTATSFTDTGMLTTSYPYGSGYYSVAGFGFTATSGVRGVTSPGPLATNVYCYGYTSTCQ